MWACEFLVITFLSVSTSDRECVNNGMLGLNNCMLDVNKTQFLYEAYLFSFFQTF
jgi:hypothetical protein